MLQIWRLKVVCCCHLWTKFESAKNGFRRMRGQKNFARGKTREFGHFVRNNLTTEMSVSLENTSSSVPAFLTKLWLLVEEESTDDLICWDSVGWRDLSSDETSNVGVLIFFIPPPILHLHLHVWRSLRYAVPHPLLFSAVDTCANCWNLILNFSRRNRNWNRNFVSNRFEFQESRSRSGLFDLIWPKSTLSIRTCYSKKQEVLTDARVLRHQGTVRGCARPAGLPPPTKQCSVLSRVCRNAVTCKEKKKSLIKKKKKCTRITKKIITTRQRCRSKGEFPISEARSKQFTGDQLPV